MTTTLWTSTQINHPWFTRQPMKRKSSMYGDDNTLPSPSLKRPRRKNQTLEHDFADLTLEYAPPTPFPAPSPFANLPSPPLLFAYPPAPIPATDSPQPIQDVQMSISTWYEPEKDRIVVTSLDDSDCEPDESERNSDVCISPVLLEEVKRKQTRSHLPPPLPSNCQALVLYRPLIPPKSDDPLERAPSSVPTGTLINDAMDVEP